LILHLSGEPPPEQKNGGTRLRVPPSVNNCWRL
jgi:hypothetical protein